MKSRIEKILFAVLLATPSFASAAILDNLKGEDKAKDLGAIDKLITNVSSIVTNTAGAIALLMIIFGGMTYITSAGNTERAEKGKKILTYAIGGLLLVILAKIILRVFATLLGGSYQ